MLKLITTQYNLSETIKKFLKNIKNQKSFHDNVKKNIKLFDIQQINKLSFDKKKQLFDIFNENTNDSFQLEKIATWLIDKMGGEFNYHNHYYFDQTFITVKKLTRNFVKISGKTKKNLISQKYEDLCNSEDLTKDNAYHYLILTGLSLYVFQNKDLIIKKEQNRLNKENKYLPTTDEEPDPETEIEQSLSLEFSDSEWEEIELGYANHLKYSLSENEESATKQSIDSSKFSEDSTNLAWDDTELLSAYNRYNINSYSKSESNQKINFSWVHQPEIKVDSSSLTSLEAYSSDNKKLETKQPIDDSKSAEDSTDLEWNHIKLDLATSTETSTSQNKISSDSKQENKYAFFPSPPVAKNEGHYSELLQNGMEKSTMKTAA